MVSKGAKFLYGLSSDIQKEQEKQQNQEINLENAQNLVSGKEAGNTSEEEKIQIYSIQHLDLSKDEKAYVNELDYALNNIATISDKEVKKLYKELKVKFYEDKKTKKQFKQSKKIVKAMIKSDKKRTNLRYITKAGKYTAILSALTGVYMGLKNDYVPIRIVREIDQSTIDYLLLTVKSNLQYYNIKVPEAEILAGAFALGVAGYITGKGLVKLDDLKTLRRLMVQVCGENMSISELQSLKNAIKEDGNGVKEAMITYPLRDYGKTSETISHEKWMKLKYAMEENEKKDKKMSNTQKEEANKELMPKSKSEKLKSFFADKNLNEENNQQVKNDNDNETEIKEENVSLVIETKELSSDKGVNHDASKDDDGDDGIALELIPENNNIENLDLEIKKEIKNIELENEGCDLEIKDNEENIQGCDLEIKVNEENIQGCDLEITDEKLKEETKENSKEEKQKINKDMDYGLSM